MNNKINRKISEHKEIKLQIFKWAICQEKVSKGLKNT